MRRRVGYDKIQTMTKKVISGNHLFMQIGELCRTHTPAHNFLGSQASVGRGSGALRAHLGLGSRPCVHIFVYAGASQGSTIVIVDTRDRNLRADEQLGPKLTDTVALCM